MKRILTKRNVLVSLGIVVVLVIGVATFKRDKRGEGGQEGTVVRKDIQQTLTVSGKVLAGQQATLNFSGVGRLAYVGADEGDMVEKGKLLAVQDLGDLQASERAAYYNYLAADANAHEIEDQVKGHDTDESFAQKNDRVAAQTARDKAYDTWLTSQRAIKNAKLVAPFAGIVTHMTATTIGDTVGVSDGVTVVNPNSLYFEIEVDETDLAQISVGKTVTLKLDALASSLTGTISSIGYEARTSSSGANVFPVKVALGVDTSSLRVGMNGDVEIVTSEAKNVLVVPAAAVSDGKVTVIRGGNKVLVTVEVGLETDAESEIKSGLVEGDTLWLAK